MNHSITDKLRLEFENSESNDYKNKKFDYIVVFSAEENDISGENEERFLGGLKFCKKDSILIYLGTKTHNQNVKKFLKNFHARFQVEFPSNRKETTTKTQIKDLVKFLNKEGNKKILFVSNSYHIPRIKRYCKNYFPIFKNLSFFGVGKIANQKIQVETEIKKILSYSKKGDLPLFIS